MKYGFVLPGGTATQQIEHAILADQNGWDGIFVWEAAYGVDPGPCSRQWRSARNISSSAPCSHRCPGAAPGSWPVRSSPWTKSPTDAPSLPWDWAPLVPASEIRGKSS